MISQYVRQRIQDEAFGESPRTVGENRRAVSRFTQRRLANKKARAELPRHYQTENQDKPSLQPQFKPIVRS